LPAGEALKGRPEDLQIDTTFMKTARRIGYAGNKLSATETSKTLKFEGRDHRCERLLVQEAFKIQNPSRRQNAGPHH
jgi:hypothetical protein